MQLKLNTILHTKDGRKIGNAIITAVNKDIFEVTTDYGNKVTLTGYEIYDLFYIACNDVQEYFENHKNRCFT